MSTNAMRKTVAQPELKTMTIYIVLSTDTDLVTRYDNVISLLCFPEKKEINLRIAGQFEDYTVKLDNVLSFESN